MAKFGAKCQGRQTRPPCKAGHPTVKVLLRCVCLPSAFFVHVNVAAALLTIEQHHNQTTNFSRQAGPEPYHQLRNRSPSLPRPPRDSPRLPATPHSQPQQTPQATPPLLTTPNGHHRPPPRPPGRPHPPRPHPHARQTPPPSRPRAPPRPPVLHPPHHRRPTHRQPPQDVHVGRIQRRSRKPSSPPPHFPPSPPN